jgi:hypothetical protein
MKKNIFKALVDVLRRRKGGFTKLLDNPAGTKFRNACKHETRRGADGTMR